MLLSFFPCVTFFFWCRRNNQITFGFLFWYKHKERWKDENMCTEFFSIFLFSREWERERERESCKKCAQTTTLLFTLFGSVCEELFTWAVVVRRCRATKKKEEKTSTRVNLFIRVGEVSFNAKMQHEDNFTTCYHVVNEAN